jgi:hypothetical protein
MDNHCDLHVETNGEGIEGGWECSTGSSWRMLNNMKPAGWTV